MSLSLDTRFLIVGSGCFGISTAYHLLLRGYKHVTVVDRAETLPSPDAASTDLNKIVRAVYQDPFYCNLGRRAIEEWTSSKIWQDAYFQSGLLFVAHKASAMSFESAISTRTDLTELTSQATIDDLFPEEFHRGALGEFIAPNAGFSKAAGSVSATRAIQNTIDAVMSLGGDVLPGKAAKELIRDANGKVVGMRFADGSDIKADVIILATGAWTASAFPELGLAKHIFASGQSIAKIKLSPELAERYRKCPIVLHYELGFYIFPPNEDNLMKLCTHSAGYTHFKAGDLSGRADEISTPRTILTDGEDGLRIPRTMVTHLRELLAKMYPELAEMPFESTRLCWYTYTNDEDWLIDAVPGNDNLFVATGGSGHGFKFLPVIGGLIADRIEGKLSTEIKAKFSLGRDRGTFKSKGVFQDPRPLKIEELCTQSDLKCQS